jgi:hypothetical protein
MRLSRLVRVWRHSSREGTDGSVSLSDGTKGGPLVSSEIRFVSVPPTLPGLELAHTRAWTKSTPLPGTSRPSGSPVHGADDAGFDLGVGLARDSDGSGAIGAPT